MFAVWFWIGLSELFIFLRRQEVAVEVKVSLSLRVLADGPLFSVSLIARIPGVTGVLRFDLSV